MESLSAFLQNKVGRISISGSDIVEKARLMMALEYFMLNSSIEHEVRPNFDIYISSGASLTFDENATYGIVANISTKFPQCDYNRITCPADLIDGVCPTTLIDARLFFSLAFCLRINLRLFEPLTQVVLATEMDDPIEWALKNIENVHREPILCSVIHIIGDFRDYRSIMGCVGGPGEGVVRVYQYVRPEDDNAVIQKEMYTICLNGEDDIVVIPSN